MNPKQPQTDVELRTRELEQIKTLAQLEREIQCVKLQWNTDYKKLSNEVRDSLMPREYLGKWIEIQPELCINVTASTYDSEVQLMHFTSLVQGDAA